MKNIILFQQCYDNALINMLIYLSMIMAYATDAVKTVILQ